tara:strand:- start:60 stop:473 length:414 start_codon:yes stop_codon:yes gene_type:complete
MRTTFGILMLAGSFLAACGGWLRTGHYDVEENVAVISHMFNLTVRDASTDRLMTSAFAEAHRVEDARITNLTIADDSGKIQLEVLPGAFDIEVQKENYDPVILRNVSTLNSVRELGDIRLTPLNPRSPPNKGEGQVL